MNIPKELQEEILTEFNKMLNRVQRSKKLSREGTRIHAFDRGLVLGWSGAIMIIESWNDPNHGKVVAKPA